MFFYGTQKINSAKHYVSSIENDLLVMLVTPIAAMN